MTDDTSPGLTHVDGQGRVHMVETGHKRETERRAVARARVRMKAETADRLEAGALGKGDGLAVARVAGIMAAKDTPRLIPLCHAIRLTSARVGFHWRDEEGDGGGQPVAGHRLLEITAEVRAVDRTGVEMEALTAASVAALTVYDMCKAVDDGLRIERVELLIKEGGARDVHKGGAGRLPPSDDTAAAEEGD